MVALLVKRVEESGSAYTRLEPWSAMSERILRLASNERKVLIANKDGARREQTLRREQSTFG